MTHQIGKSGDPDQEKFGASAVCGNKSLRYQKLKVTVILPPCSERVNESAMGCGSYLDSQRRAHGTLVGFVENVKIRKWPSKKGKKTESSVPS